MKRSHNSAKNIGKKSAVFAPRSHAKFLHRKIPEKPRGSRRDEERICGKEKRQDALISEEPEEEK